MKKNDSKQGGKFLFAYTLKLLIVMKLTICLFLVSVISVFAGEGYSQNAKLSLDLDQATIEDVLGKIENQSEFYFLYSEKVVDVKKRVSISLKNREIESVLNALFEGSEIAYVIKDRQIVLSSQDQLQNESTSTWQKASIQGTVTDESGEPLPGVAIIIKGTTTGTITNFEGVYNLVDVPSGATLVFSFVGMKPSEILLGSQTTVDVIMMEDAIGLEEVVAIGYGSTKKRDLVSSVSSIEAEVLQNSPTPRLDQALQGRATGVEVTSNNGAPGAAATIRIRGTSSINGNNNPLYVVDGFIAGTDFNLNTLSVNDIKSIEVLKDATALSIYGTRGASGVILVTTKSGKKVAGGKPQVSVNHYTTLSSIANNYEVLTGQNYIDYKNEESQFSPSVNDGFGGTNSSLPLAFPGVAADYPNTDWLSPVEQTGIIHNTDVSITGGSENLSYYMSINRFDQEGVIKESGLERYSFRTNLDYDISDLFKTGVRLSITNVDTEDNKVDWFTATNRLLSIRPIYNEDGTYDGVNPQSGRDERNPIADVALRQANRNDREIIANGYIQFEPISGLVFKSTVGTSLSSLRRNSYNPGELPERRQNGLGGAASIRQNRKRSVLNENTVTYKKQVDDHSFTILAGATWQKDVFETTNMNASGFVNDAVGYNNISLGSAQTTYGLDSRYVQRTFASILARIEYSYQSKYLLTLVGRRDGSSVFQEGNKHAFFPSAGIGWNVHEEDFIKSINAISKLKLRASYGVVGEQGVNPYNSLASFTGTSTYFNNNLFNAVIIGDLPSDNLGWETTKQLDLGVELGLLKGRITLEASYYQKTTEDLLLEKKIPGTAGDTRLQNIGEIKNNGIEFNIKSINISKPDFFWETSLSISANRNTVESLGDQQYIDLLSGMAGGSSMRLIKGETVPAFYGLQYLGTYKSKEEIIADNRTGKSFIGGPRFLDKDGNGEFTDADREVLGSPEPKFYGGLRNAVSYKGLSLDMFIQFTYGNEILNNARQTFIFGKEDFNLSTEVLNRWQEGINESSDIPRAGASQGAFFPPNSMWVEDASFIRLKQLTLSYDLPTKKLGLGRLFKKASVYITGTNLLLLSNFSLGDPEVNYFDEEADLRKGVYSGQYPYTRSFTAGVKLDF